VASSPRKLYFRGLFWKMEWPNGASTIPPNAAPEAGLRAKVGPVTVNTRFNSGAITRMIGQARVGLGS
jgi:hypothetical protein